MFRIIGGAVVYGLALYGAAKLFEGSKTEGRDRTNGGGPAAKGDHEGQPPAEGTGETKGLGPKGCL